MKIVAVEQLLISNNFTLEEFTFHVKIEHLNLK